ncbi:MAG: 3-oxoacyl-ACP reductase FabG [Clostridia bacterium]|nr:3-oxoacyl-ACP reductase FabG [Clostridia bacterium]
MKRVLITGGSRGIGRELVKKFSREGYAVAFTYKASRDAANELAAEFGAYAIKADSELPEEIERAVALALEHLGGIDILINNAGISSFSLLQELSVEEWQRTLAVNLTAPFIYSKAVIPGMVSEKWGRIINISSIWGLVGSSCEAHYSASKAGLIGLTKALSKELGPSGITVNAIAPGVINTEMNKSLGEDTVRELCDETPLMRCGECEDVAEAALFLASERASFITGDVLNVSGGFVIT